MGGLPVGNLCSQLITLISVLQSVALLVAIGAFDYLLVFLLYTVLSAVFLSTVAASRLLSALVCLVPITALALIALSWLPIDVVQGACVFRSHLDRSSYWRPVLDGQYQRCSFLGVGSRWV